MRDAARVAVGWELWSVALYVPGGVRGDLVDGIESRRLAWENVPDI
jgi:hypothetical protein